MLRLRTILGPVAVVCVLAIGAAAGTAPSPMDGAFHEMLAAIQARSIDQFVSRGDDGFRAMPESEFDGLAEKFAPMLSSGYKASYLGEFREAGTAVYYWKLTFTSDPDDWLAKVGVRDGKVRGLLIQRP